MEYHEALAYLQGLGRFGVSPGLERIERLLDRLGQPHKRLRVIHVAGTNGKGSTAAMIASVLRAAGCRTGLYTSPHLMSYTERISLDGRPIPPDRFAAIVGRIKGLINPEMIEAGGHPTEFEVGTAAMYQYFSEEGAEVVVQETGLGGRLDATNVIEKPLVTVITPVALDHTDRLGGSLESIAREKAGVIKPGVPVVSSPQDEKVLPVLEEVARAKGCRLWVVGRDVKFSVKRVSLEGTEFSCEGEKFSFARVHTSLLGAHQAANGATAIAALAVLRGLGWRLPEEVIWSGLALVRWPGRLEVVEKGRFPVPIVLDGAHNPAGARVLTQALQQLLPGKPCVMVVAVMKDKDIPAVMTELARVAKAFVLTRVSDSRCAPPDDLARCLPPGTACEIEPDPGCALAVAVRRAERDGFVCVTGSLYLIGAAKMALQAWRSEGSFLVPWRR